MKCSSKGLQFHENVSNFYSQKNVFYGLSRDYKSESVNFKADYRFEEIFHNK